MKKMFVLVLLVPMLTIAFISCDADMRSNLAGLMGGLGGNVYIDNGLVEPDTAAAEAAVAVIATLGTAGSTTTASDSASATIFGLTEVDLSALSGDTTVLAPQSEEEQEELKADIATTFASPTQTETLLEELKAPATDEQKAAVIGTTTVFNAVVDELANTLASTNPSLASAIQELALPELDADDEISQGDLLILQMMTNLISNTVATLNTVSSNNIGGLTDAHLEENQDEVLSIVDDAIFTAQIAEKLSGSATIDFSGQIDLVALLENLNKSTSREAIVLTDALEDFLAEDFDEWFADLV